MLNEAMNSGCAMINQSTNGLAYKNGDRKQLLSHVKYLATQSDIGEKMGRNAYETVKQTWNAKTASKALLDICEKLLGNEQIHLPKNGPGSKAKVISQRSMYDSLINKNI